MGLEKIYQLTSTGNYKLRLEVQAVNGEWFSVEYDTFSISSESTSYTLSVSGYSGDIPDVMNYHNGMVFTTFDLGDCASWYSGGWWWNYCHDVCMNGLYFQDGFAYHHVNGTWIYFNAGRLMMKRV